MTTRLWPALATSLALAAPFLTTAAFAQDAAPEAAPDDCKVREYTMGLRFQQQSAEIQALQLQAFQLATLRLDAAVEGVEDRAKLAVVTDLDETVIDNSALLARDLTNCHTYDGWDTWTHWEREGKPVLIPGAKEFLDHANSLGVSIYYISDRTDEFKDATLASLNELALPQVKPETVLLLGPPKVERREIVEKDHKIIMLLGDTLHDFDGGFRKTPLDVQKALVHEKADKFGKEWIMLPNASYGTWSKADLQGWDAEIVTGDY